jgi:integrase
VAAHRFEEKRKEEAHKIVAEIRASGTGPLTLKAACDRWWREHGSTLADVGIKSALDRLVEIIGGKTYLHDITDDTVSRMVQERRKDGRRDRTIRAPDGKQTILYREITPGGGERIKDQRYPITYWGFTTHCRRQWKKAGVKARIHDLRHTTGMRTLRRTKNLRVVQELLGHTEIKTTATFYTAALVEDLRSAMEETAPSENVALRLVEKKE